MYKEKGSGSLSSVKGMCSYKKNPMSKPKEVPVGLGSSSNSDKAKANKLLLKANKQQDSLRGISGI